MGERTSPTPSELRERLPKSVEEFNGIFESNHGDNTHVIVHEDEVGQFFKAVREMGLETDTYRPPDEAQGLRGYVE